MNKQYSFLAGLPRTGSTLLSSIISQNPKIHAEGTSHLCELLWNVFRGAANETQTGWEDHIICGNKQQSIRNILRSLPDLYYQDVNKSFILDKGRTWTYPGNLSILKTFIIDRPKIVVLVRPLEEVVASFVRIQRANRWGEENIFGNIFEENGPVMLHVNGVELARQHNQGEFLFIEYDDLVFDTNKTLKRIYDFCEWPNYEHQLHNIERPFIQRDECYNMIGLHDVRKTIEKQKYEVELPEEILQKCRSLNPLILGK